MGDDGYYISAVYIAHVITMWVGQLFHVRSERTVKGEIVYPARAPEVISGNFIRKGIYHFTGNGSWSRRGNVFSTGGQTAV